MTADNGSRTETGIRARLGFVRRAPLVIWLAIALHLITGAVLLAADTNVLPTPIGDLRYFLTQDQIGYLFLAVGSLSAVGTAARTRVKALVRWAPQQFVLIFSALSSARAVINGHYADGVPRPWEFILVDQLPSILLALVFIAALVRWARRAD